MTLPPDEQRPAPIGAPLDEDELMAFAEVDELDIERAIAWFNRNASPEWAGALDTEPVDGPAG